MALLTLSYRHRLLLYSDKSVLLMNTVCNSACRTKLLQSLLMNHFTYQPFQSQRNIPKIQPYCPNYPKSSLRTVDIDKNDRVREIVVFCYWSTIKTVCLNKNADNQWFLFIYELKFPLFFVLWKMRKRSVHISLIDVSHTKTIVSIN